MSSAGPEARPAAGESPEATEGPQPLVVLDARLDAERADQLGAELGRPLVRLDPKRLEGEAIERIAAARAVVVPWDLETQSGLDLVESLRLRKATRRTPILMVAPRPTRTMVLAALRAGASGFAFQPYEAAELRVRLDALGGSPG